MTDTINALSDRLPAVRTNEQFKRLLQLNAEAEVSEMIRRDGLKVDSNSMWAKDLANELAEVLEAAAEGRENAPMLRARYNARRLSFLETQKKQLEAEEVRLNNPLRDLGRVNTDFSRFYGSQFAHNLSVNTTTAQALRPGSVIPVDTHDEITVLSVSPPTETAAPERTAAMDEQKFIQRVGMLSNLNVTVQEKKLNSPGGIQFYNRDGSKIVPKAHSLYCDVCYTRETIDSRIVVARQIDDPGLVKFCRAHRHDSDTLEGTNIVTEGRKFKEL